MNLPPFFPQAITVSENLVRQCFFFSAMPVDPTLAEGTVNQADSTLSSHLYAVALKLPVFWPDSCESWFINAESQFHLKSIPSSITKFHHVVASLPQKEIDNVVDIIRHPLAEDPYGVLRSRLLQVSNGLRML